MERRPLTSSWRFRNASRMGVATLLLALITAAGCSSGEPEYLTDIFGWPNYVPERLSVERAFCFGARFGHTNAINFVPIGSETEDRAFSVLFLDWVPDFPLDDVIPTMLEDVASVSPSEVRDLDGFSVHFQSPETNEEWTGLVWQEGKVLVVVAGPVLTSDEVAKVAASLEPATAAEFESCS